MSVKNNKVILFILIIVLQISNTIHAQDIDPEKTVQETLKKKEDKIKMSGEKVGFLPFEHTYGVSKTYARFAQNEIVYYMAKSQKYHPQSLKEWATEKFSDMKGISINNIIVQSRKYEIPAVYICHGMVFKVGRSYGLKVSLYPLDKNIKPSYYYRSFNNRRELKYIAHQIVDEISRRANSPDASVFNKKIFIKNFSIDFKLQSRSQSGEVITSELPFYVYKKTELKNTDNFFNELLLYNFHVSRIFEVWNNNMSSFVIKELDLPENQNFDYSISGNITISKDDTFITLSVRDVRKGKIVFSNRYFLESLDLEYIYQAMRLYVKDITYALLTPEEEEQIGEAELTGYYSNEPVFCDNYYLGKGAQKDLLFPVGLSTVRVWFGETVLTDLILNKKNLNTGQKYLSGLMPELEPELPGQFAIPGQMPDQQWDKYEYINIRPKSVSKLKESFFKVSLGFLIDTGFYFHPKYNEKSIATFNAANEYEYYLGDILKDKDIKDSFSYLPSYQVGGGIDLSLISKHFAAFNQLFFKFGHIDHTFKVSPSGTIEVPNNAISDLDLKYSLQKFNFTFEYGILPAALLLKSDSPFRIYTGLGFFTNLVYSRFTEKLKGNGIIGTDIYGLDISYGDNRSLFFNSGIFPEFGFLTTASKFNFKIGIAYYLDVFKVNLFTNKFYSIMDTYNTSTFKLKIGFGYYLN